MILLRVDNGHCFATNAAAARLTLSLFLGLGLCSFGVRSAVAGAAVLTLADPPPAAAALDL